MPFHGFSQSPTDTTMTPIMPQSGARSMSRNFGSPKPEDIDPEFTNRPEFVRFQRWELLESAKRWLPGESTIIMWKGFCYVIGAPIHMGMNGHIHFCYRYKLPESATDDEDTAATANQSQAEFETTTATTTREESHSSINFGRLAASKFTKKDVVTLAAKIVPNTSAFAREIVILRDLQVILCNFWKLFVFI
ncbi:hypothetical protein RFI_36353 [Reticulomyxa filosa]|uniref:Uncharacterized protein n=1 Tax=Reticulomyxa filosa TaxID=46433 RepID=X6LIV5_RETFI|nr:hypothetical protein RFI_36353 [Reticulomyxa filosa]|eukprot:ETO01087.1 hypothetical protein RFI_36353 [Reticulomyxa filosa]